MGHKVLFFGPPDPAQRRIRLDHTLNDGARLLVVRSPRVARGLAHMPAFLRIWLERRWLRALERNLGARIDLVWTFENSRFFDARFAGNRAKIYHQVDLNQAFHPSMAAATADLAIANSGPIERRIRPSAKKLLRLGHGVAHGPDQPLPDTLLKTRFSPDRRHAVLTGNLDMAYIDNHLLTAIVRDHPEIAFHLVGSYKTSGRLYKTLGSAPNVVWWGQQPHAVLPSILRCGDLLLVIYQADHHREQLANPHKIMEYLSSGRPILATYTEEYADRPDLVVMAEDEMDFCTKFTALMDDHAKLANKIESLQRRRYAAEHTYQQRIASITRALDGAFHGPNPLRFQSK